MEQRLNGLRHTQEKEKAAQQVEELNDIVFSKTFKAPSAWADRERKYKMESRDWAEKVQSHNKLHCESAAGPILPTPA